MQKEFGFFRSFFWPVYAKELPKLIPMLIICFFIAFNYYLLRSAKDALIINAASSGAAAIPFIYVWGILPMAFFLTMIFTKLSNRYSRSQIFYGMSLIFLGFFTLFITVLYPFKEWLRPTSFANFLTTFLPSGFSGLIAMVENWVETSFYIMAELWGTIVFYVAFWSFANDITTVHEAKRVYSLFGVAAHLSGIGAGKLSMTIASMSKQSTLPWLYSLQLTCSTFLIVGLITIILFWFLNQKILPSLPKTEEKHVSEAKTAKQKMTLIDNFKFVAKSRYLAFMAISVFIYYTTINLTDVLWKNKVYEYLPNPVDYNAYMGKITLYTSIIAMITALFITGNVIRRFGWLFSAMITPVILLVTTVGFFSSLFLEKSIFLTGLLAMSPLSMAVFFGSAQNVLSRASKYTLFDPTKEMAFIPLDQTSKIKGKAAIDGVGARLGKSMGSVIYQGLFLFLPTLAATTSYVAFFVCITSMIWIWAVYNLGKGFEQMTAEA